MRAYLLSDASSVMLAAADGTLNFQTLVEYFAYIAAIILVTVIATLWISGNRATLRRSDGRPDESRGRSRGWFGLNEGKRRRRRAHRRRNPTLAETGGLPPVRTEAPPPATGKLQN